LSPDAVLTRLDTTLTGNVPRAINPSRHSDSRGRTIASEQHGQGKRATRESWRAACTPVTAPDVRYPASGMCQGA
jgi:hypothetical protein